MVKEILFHVDIAEYKRGDKIPYNTAPSGPRHWVDNGSILVESKICSIVNNDINVRTNNQDEIDKMFDSDDSGNDNDKDNDNDKNIDESNIINTDNNLEQKNILPICKGFKNNGSPCRSNKLLENGYCYAHQNQAGGNSIDKSNKSEDFTAI